MRRVGVVVVLAGCGERWNRARSGDRDHCCE
jgi:hypothetical protein